MLDVLEIVFAILGVVLFVSGIVDIVSDYLKLRKRVQQGGNSNASHIEKTKAKNNSKFKRFLKSGKWMIPLAVVMIVCSVAVGQVNVQKRKEAANAAEIARQNRAKAAATTSQEPTRYEKMQAEIEKYLYDHNDTSKMFDCVKVERNNGKLEFNVTLEAYETYTFAAVTSAATDSVRKIVKEYDIKEYRLWVHSPSDAKYTVSWISFNLDLGLIDDKGYNGRYNEMIKLDTMLKHYGYEDYEGKLSDFLKEQNSTSR